MKKSTTVSLVHQLRNPASEKALEVRVRVRRVETCSHCGTRSLHKHGAMPRRRAPARLTITARQWYIAYCIQHRSSYA
jgi:hypothetical protein